MDFPHARGSDALQWREVRHQTRRGCLPFLIYASRSTIRLTLENISPLPVDFFTLSFDDSTIAPAQEALAEGQLSVFEAFETQYDLIHRQAFSWNKDKEVKVINPGQKIVVSVACFGKVKWCVSSDLYF